MTLEIIGLIVIAVLLLLVYQAWRENKQLDRSWNKMHDLFLRQVSGDILNYGSIGWKHTAMEQIIKNTYPTFDNGYAHFIMRTTQ